MAFLHSVVNTDELLHDPFDPIAWTWKFNIKCQQERDDEGEEAQTGIDVEIPPVLPLVDPVGINTDDQAIGQDDKYDHQHGQSPSLIVLEVLAVLSMTISHEMSTSKLGKYSVIQSVFIFFHSLGFCS